MAGLLFKIFVFNIKQIKYNYFVIRTSALIFEYALLNSMNEYLAFCKFKVDILVD